MPKYNHDKGFTLIEVIAVLLLLSITSLIVVSRMASSDEADIRAKAEILRGHIRYVQMRAMNTDADKSAIATCNSSFGISMSANSYFMFRDCDKNLKVVLPGADTADVILTNMILSPTYDVTFDGWGRPCLDADWTGRTPSTADINFTIGTEPIKITKNTGHVP